MWFGNKATFCACWWLQALIQWTLLLVTRHYCLALFLGKSVLLEIWGWVAVIKAITWGSILRYSAQYSLILFACVWGPEWLLLYFLESSMWNQGNCPLPPLSVYNKVCMSCPQQQNHLNLEMVYNYLVVYWEVLISVSATHVTLNESDASESIAWL